MVYVHLAEGFEEIEALTIVDVLRRGEIHVNTVSMEETKAVTGTHGVTVGADVLFADADYSAADMIVLPGGLPGTTNLLKNRALGREIENFAQLGRWVCAICAAPWVLGHYGVLKGKRATIYPGMEDKIPEAIPVTDERVVVDGKIITSQGPGTAMEFALALVEAIKGRSTAEELREDLLFRPL